MKKRREGSNDSFVHNSLASLWARAETNVHINILTRDGCTRSRIIRPAAVRLMIL